MNNYYNDLNDGEVYSRLTPEERKSILRTALILCGILLLSGLTIYLIGW